MSTDIHSDGSIHLNTPTRSTPTPTPIEQPDKELRERVRALKLPDTTVYSMSDLTVGNLVDTSLEEQIMSLIESHTNAAIEKYEEERDKQTDLKHPYQSIRRPHDR